jgi:hypothetical protein
MVSEHAGQSPFKRAMSIDAREFEATILRRDLVNALTKTWQPSLPGTGSS